ncbi:unnamed protein product [Echinostoma caproni]|uniref:Fibronectin type-III domain-containing protein n=1 Tax=Echinostoma caproni TaxID=27848 RepID=A0A183BA75_9TREM|nr:unnamed protein product [Echinostoma caproni]
MPSSTTESLNVIHFTIKDTAYLLSVTKSSSRPGPDGLPPSTIRFEGPDMPFILLKLFSLSLIGGIVPSQWKQSSIIPLHQTGPTHEPSNYLDGKIVKRHLSEYVFNATYLARANLAFLNFVLVKLASLAS